MSLLLNLEGSNIWFGCDWMVGSCTGLHTILLSVFQMIVLAEQEEGSMDSGLVFFVVSVIMMEQRVRFDILGAKSV